MSRTASSTILPDLVRGMSATATILAGTCRGLAPARIPALMRATRASSRRAAAGAVPCREGGDRGGVEAGVGGEPQEKKDAHGAGQILADRQRLEALGDLLDLPVDFGGADTHPAGIEGGVGAAVDDQAAM